MSPVSGDVPSGVLRHALDGLVPYEPGKPVEEVQRELGLERVVKLASNEGPFGPFPAAAAAIERATAELNRYPDGGCYRLRAALAELHDVRFEEVAVCAGADAVIGCICQATLDVGDEVVTGWPSFVSYVIDPLKLGAVPVRVPLRDDRFDLDALLGAITARTKLVFIATPNNPTGTMTSRAELDSYFDRVPDHVLTVVDQAYFEYIDDPAYPDAIADYAKRGRQVLVLRTFSKIYGLAGLRIGYGATTSELADALERVREPFNVSSVAQAAALASLQDGDQVARTRELNREARDYFYGEFQRLGLEYTPSYANFVWVDLGRECRPVFTELLKRGVIVRTGDAFGAPTHIRVTTGTPQQNQKFVAALDEVLGAG